MWEFAFVVAVVGGSVSLLIVWGTRAFGGNSRESESACAGRCAGCICGNGNSESKTIDDAPPKA